MFDLDASGLNEALIDQSSFLQSYLLRVAYILVKKAEANLDLEILLALLTEEQSCLFQRQGIEYLADEVSKVKFIAPDQRDDSLPILAH